MVSNPQLIGDDPSMNPLQVSHCGMTIPESHPVESFGHDVSAGPSQEQQLEPEEADRLVDPSRILEHNLESFHICFNELDLGCSIPRFAWGGRPHRRLPCLPKPLKTPLFTLCSSIVPCWPTQTYIQKVIQKHCFFLQCFYNVVHRKHRNLRVFRHENIVIYTVFFHFSMCQCRWPTQTYIQQILQNIVLFQCFYIFFVKNTVIYTFFGLKSVQNTGFCSVFNALASKNHSKYGYFRCFFHFCPFFPCRKPTKMTQNSVSMAS